LYKPTLKEWWLLFLVAASSLFFHQLFMAYGVVTTTATNASILLGLNPLTTAVLAALFIGEKFNMKLGIGILLGFSGVLLVVVSNSLSDSIGFSGWGDIMMFMAMLTYVIGGLIIKKMSHSSMPTLVMTAYSTVIGGILLNVAVIIALGPSSYQQVQLPAMAWTILLLSAWGATAMGALGWNHGIKHLGANRTAMFVNGMPFVSMLGGVVFLNERIGWIHIVALLLTTTGIVIGTRKSPQKSEM
jgi:drug/metabolite transporter (DMT)-like permease